MKQTRAVVLLSGGADSATCLALARARGREVFALSFDYGQRHAVELHFARGLARRYRCAAHRVVKVDLAGSAASALTSRKIPVPRASARRGRIPVTYVPGRNTIFLAHALSWAEAVGAPEIWIGANVIDYSGYPDCRPEYLRAFEKTANLATKAGVENRTRFKVVSPLLKMTKLEILDLGASLGLDYGWTFSCYNPTRKATPCGECASCRIRDRALRSLERNRKAGGQLR
ncbi:MAG: 7-cyano-7-deazaguanine synthase QueC [Thermoanaerobaculia bacterium]